MNGARFVYYICSISNILEKRGFLFYFFEMSSPANSTSFHDLLLQKLAQSGIEKPEDVKFVRVLKNSFNFKRISVEFTYAGSAGVLILEKSFFDDSSVENLTPRLLDDSIIKPLTNLFRNDSYGAYHMELKDSAAINEWNK